MNEWNSFSVYNFPLSSVISWNPVTAICSSYHPFLSLLFFSISTAEILRTWKKGVNTLDYMDQGKKEWSCYNRTWEWESWTIENLQERSAKKVGRKKETWWWEMLCFLDKDNTNFFVLSSSFLERSRKKKQESKRRKKEVHDYVYIITDISAHHLFFRYVVPTAKYMLYGTSTPNWKWPLRMKRKT